MDGILLFSIPIYLRSLEENIVANNQKMELFVKEMLSRSYHSAREEYERDFKNRYWSHWQYTEIVGYVELRLVDRTIKAYYWFVDAERPTAKMRNKRFRYAGKISDVCKHTTGKVNQDIVKDIRRFIGHLPSLQQRFKGRHFDITALEQMLDFMDFKNLLTVN